MRRDLFICSLCWLLIPLSCGYMDPCCTPEQKHWKHLKSHTLILTLAGPPKNSSILYFFVIWSVNNLQSGKCPETGKRQNPLLRKSLGTPSTFFTGLFGNFFPNAVLPTSQSPSDLIFSRYCVVQDLMCVLVCISRLFFQYEEKLHTLHLLSFSSLCELECFLSEST